jgi:hypothetical protein
MEVTEWMLEKHGDLVAFLQCFGSLRDDTLLHALVYSAQQLRLLKTEYEFTFRTNAPYSSDLASDLYDLKRHNVVQDTRNTNSIYVTPQPGLAPCDIGGLRELDAGTLLVTSRLLRRLAQAQSGEPDIGTVASLMVKRDRVPADMAQRAVAFLRAARVA